MTTGDVSNNTYYPVANLFAERMERGTAKRFRRYFRNLMSRRCSDVQPVGIASLQHDVYRPDVRNPGGIIVSPVFSDEYTSGWTVWILTSRYGKKAVCAGKGFLRILLQYHDGSGDSADRILMFCRRAGLAGWDTDIQLSEMMVFSRIRQPLKCCEAAF